MARAPAAEAALMHAWRAPELSHRALADALKSRTASNTLPAAGHVLLKKWVPAPSLGTAAKMAGSPGGRSTTVTLFTG